MARIIDCCYAECHYVECRYAECRYAECHGVALLSLPTLGITEQTESILLCHITHGS
jgi:hypothetical protein